MSELTNNPLTMRTITANELAEAITGQRVTHTTHGTIGVQLDGDSYSIIFNIDPGNGQVLFSHTQHELGKRGGAMYGSRQIARIERALGISFKVADAQELALAEANPIELAPDPTKAIPPALAIPDHVAAKLYTRFTRLRFGGVYPSRPSIRHHSQPEPFNADRVRQLLSQQHPATQAIWCSEVGHVLKSKP